MNIEKMQLLETIKCIDGKLCNLERHQERLNRSRKKCFGARHDINLQRIVQVPEKAKTGLFRCRIVYSEKVESIAFIPHQYRQVNSFKLVENNHIDYTCKFANRETLNQLFAQRGACDDIIIVKNGLISDSSTANVLFYDGRRWWTPDTPLLAGTQRARLLEEEKIGECRISPADIVNYSFVALINAMWDMEEFNPVPTNNIVF